MNPSNKLALSLLLLVYSCTDVAKPETVFPQEEMRGAVPVEVALDSLVCCVSCFDTKEYVEVKYNKIFKPDSLYLRDCSVFDVVISAKCTWSEEFDKESRSFYQEAGNSLEYCGYRYKITNAHRELENWCAIDWRISKIEFITKKDFDEEHPAGSLLNDLLFIQYDYMYKTETKNLGEFVYGDVMLTDYYPYGDYGFHLTFGLIKQSEPYLGSLIIRITDAFGRVFTIDSDEFDRNKIN